LQGGGNADELSKLPVERSLAEVCPRGQRLDLERLVEACAAACGSGVKSAPYCRRNAAAADHQGCDTQPPLTPQPFFVLYLRHRKALLTFDTHYVEYQNQTIR
jgi:hypothetical protein